VKKGSARSTTTQKTLFGEREGDDRLQGKKKINNKQTGGGEQKGMLCGRKREFQRIAGLVDFVVRGGRKDVGTQPRISFRPEGMTAIRERGGGKGEYYWVFRSWI